MKILLATDGSEESELAAGVAVELAKSTGPELHIVHVKLIPLPPPYPDVLDWREDTSSVPRGRLGSYSMSKSRWWRRLAAPLPGPTEERNDRPRRSSRSPMSWGCA